MFIQKTSIHRGLILLVLFGTGLLTLLAGTPGIHAQGFAAGGPSALVGAPPGSNPILMMTSYLAFINSFLQVLIFIVLNFLQYLLQADFFNDPMMMSALNNIWVLSRNIMNVIFAVMLIVVAIYTIITAKSEMIKNKFGQFVIAVVLVNFSWFFPRVIIDAANILTATVYSVPEMLPGFSCVQFDGSACEVITDTLLPAPPAAIAPWMGGNGCTPATCPCFKPLFCYKKELYNAVAPTQGRAHAMINGLAVSFIHIQAMSQIPRGIGGGGGGGGAAAAFQTTFNLVLNIFMTALMQAILILPLLGLAVGLFIRIIILWITIAFMPFTFLGYVITGKLGTNIFGFEIDIWKEFINAAFLPVVVAVPFVIGFIMLSTVAKIPSPAGFQQAFGIPLLAGITTWWALLWMFAAIGIIWIGAFTALARSKITGNITNKIKGFGDTIFGIGKQLPLQIPFPVPIGGKQVNFGQLLGKPQQFLNQLRNANGNPVGGPINDEAKHAQKVSVKNIADPLQTNKIVDAINKLALGKNDGALKDLKNIIGGQDLNGAQLLTELKRIARANEADPAHAKILGLGAKITEAIEKNP